jgi:hypothetical protein
MEIYYMFDSLKHVFREGKGEEGKDYSNCVDHADTKTNY